MHIRSVKNTGRFEKVYCMTVEETHNFVVKSKNTNKKIVTSNCMLSCYCCGWSIRQILEEGVGGVRDKINSGPAKHLTSAIQQIVNFLGILQNENAGAQALSSFDTYLAPFIKKDNLTDGEIKQALQFFLFGVNVPSRWGTQAPFSNVTLDFFPPKDLIEKHPKLGGKEMPFTYGDCIEEMNRFNKIFFELFENGDASGNNFQYPIVTVNATDELFKKVPDDVQERLFRITAKYGTPYFSNFINSDLNPDDIRSMCLSGDAMIKVRLNEDIVERGNKFIKDDGNISGRIHRSGEEIEIPIGQIIDNSIECEIWTEEGYQLPLDKKVVQYSGAIRKVEFSNGSILKMTPDHIHVVDNKYIEARHLKVGDICLDNDEREITITKITDVAYDNKVYDFELSCHTFYANNVLTHNCCRLRLDKRELRKQASGGLFGAGEKTGSIGVITINFPRLGYLSKTEDEFFERLGHLMNISRDALEAKRKWLTERLEEGLYPYTKRYLDNYNQHFSTIGVLGMNECCLNLFGKDISDKECQEFTIKTFRFMKEKLRDFQEETGNLYNLESTPSESTCYRLAKHDKEKYPDIITAGTIDNPYYTNSSNLPVNFTDDVWTAIKHQEPIQAEYTGGTVFHIYLSESIDDWQKCKEFVKKVLYNSTLPYITISPSYSICQYHGYIRGETTVCPKCKAEQIEKYQKMIEKLKAKIEE